MALRLMPCSPRRRIRLVTVVGGLNGSSTPVGFELATADLAPATGVRTTWFCRTLKRRSSCTPVNRSRGSTRPATAIRADALASTTSHPAFVTTRDRPSCRNGTAGVKPLIWGLGEAEFCSSCQSAARRRAVACPAVDICNDIAGSAVVSGIATSSTGRRRLDQPGRENKRSGPYARPRYPNSETGLLLFRRHPTV